MTPQKLLDNFSTHLKNVIARAISLAHGSGRSQVYPYHLFLGLISEPGSVAVEVLAKAKFPIDELVRSVQKRQESKKVEIAPELPDLNTGSSKVIERALLIAFEMGHSYIGTEHLLAALIESKDEDVAEVLSIGKVKASHLKKLLANVSKKNDGSIAIADVTETADEEEPLDHEHPHADNEKKAKNQSAVEYFTTNLTGKAIEKKLDPVIGRDVEINRVINILCRRTKNNPVLIGEPGVGKTAIVEGLAKRIKSGDVPDILRDKKILSLDLTLMIAGTIYRGEFEARLKQVIDELSHNDQCILFIDELHTIIGAGSNQGTLDAANILKPALARGQLHCIGATTYDEYKKYVAADPALERRFQPVSVAEPTPTQTIEILNGVKKYYEEFHQLSISPAAIETAVNLSNKYLHDSFQPDKAIDLIDEAAAAVKVRRYTRTAKTKRRFSKKKNTDIVVEPTDIVTTLADRLGVDKTVLESSEWEMLERATDMLEGRLVGQTAVITDIVRTLKERYLGLGRRGKPFASFLFVGPSGVGKTELAKLLAEGLYHDEKALIKLDMSEYAEAHSVAKILGSPAGYIGYKDRNRLFDELRRRPYSVILFDEFDKAHGDVRKLLLQILDEGELTDSGGKKVHFNHAIIILTANIGADLFKSSGIGFDSIDRGLSDPSALHKKIQAAVKDEIGPAIMSRLDKICIFSPLIQEDIERIITQEIARMSTELTAAKQLSISADSAVLAALAKESFHPDLGARPVHHLIERIVPELIISVLKKPAASSRKKPKTHYILTHEKEAYVLK